MNEPESSYQDLYEDAPCGHLSMMADGTIVRVNRTFLAWTGYSPDDLVGHPFARLLTRGSQIFAETRYLPVLRLEGSVREVALGVICADGTILQTLVNSVVNDDTGLLHSAVFDATARQDYERELLDARRQAESSEERVRVLQRASAAFVGSTSEAELAEALVASMRDGFAAATAAVFLTDSHGRLRLVAGTHPVDDRNGDPTRLSRAAPVLEQDAMRGGRVVVLADRSAVRDRDPELGAGMQAERLEAVTATPLLLDGASSGVVLCFFGRARTFDENAIAVHTAIARQASEALARIRLRQELERMALFDGLTGLANRKLLTARLTEALQLAERNGHSTAVVFLDLDGFKVVNDRLGHAVGDAVLQETAGRLRGAVRPNDIVGRFGGDEFVIVCADTDLESARAIADRLRAVVAEPLSGVPAEIVVSASIGIAVHGPASSQRGTPDRLLDVADTAMYDSKKAGKNVTTAVLVD